MLQEKNYDSFMENTFQWKNQNEEYHLFLLKFVIKMHLVAEGLLLCRIHQTLHVYL